MKHFLFLALSLLMLLGCSSQQSSPSSAAFSFLHQPDDSTVVGLVCDGSNDTIVVFIRDPYDGGDPDTLNILEATNNQRVFGSLRIGDQVMMTRDTADATKASLVIIVQDLLGQWCYKVRDAQGEEQEYGFALKSDSIASPIGMQRRAAMENKGSASGHPTLKHYRKWCVADGRLLLTETRMDEQGNAIPTNTDTAELVKLSADTLILHFAHGEQSYYRKEEPEP